MRRCGVFLLFLWLHPHALHARYVIHVGSYTDREILAHQPHSDQPGAGISTIEVKEDGFGRTLHETKILNPAVLSWHPTLPLMYLQNRVYRIRVLQHDITVCAQYCT